jgi:diaminopimelate decarboxylase
VNGSFHYRDGRSALRGRGRRAGRRRVRHAALRVQRGHAILDRYREFAERVRDLDPLIAYSVKANGNLSVLRLLARAGAGADIVSGGELHRARLAGIPADRIVFSGVGKTVTELAAALDAGIIAFNVESEGRAARCRNSRRPWARARRSRCA